MNTQYYMVIIKGEIKTSEIMSCGYNRNTQKWDVKFNNGKTYSYAYLNVEKLTDPEVLNPNMYRISREGREFFDVNAIYVFRSGRESYWHICFGDGSERDYRRSDLHIIESCLAQSQSSNVFEYIKQIAGLSNLKNEETGEKLLSKKFDKISFVGSDVALAKYLNPSSLQGKRTEREYIPIFPFGCNNSQYKAVKNAMENQISVIQGPPGTGKTQTILNIIANILMQGKTVQIVSNNNSATENVYEKLSSPKYNLGFIAATLGSSKNKKLFVEHQDAAYPDFSSWKTGEDPSVLQKKIAEQSSQLKSVFAKQEKLACLRQELSQLVTEQEYFNQYVKESDVHTDSIKFKKKLSSKQWMVLWQECQLISEEKTAIGFWFKIKALFKYGVTDWSIYKQDISKIITTFQAMYYRAKQAELSAEIADIEKYSNSVNKNLLEDLCKQSMVVLKDKLARKYEGNSSRKTFSEDNLWKEPYNVLAEYPVILSTTFSSRNSLNSDVVYDYLIMDEASQVDIATGALALSCARNVVIVGDTKQLPNVVTDDIKAKAKAIFDRFNVSEGYQYTNSFLQSILDVMPNVTQTLLREHYRCHPKIINFCNQKFYRGELIIMTTDKGEEDVLSVVKTVAGNHERNHYSQRQIDVIKNEIIPKYVSNPEETGIIAPYKNQVEALSKEITDIDVGIDNARDLLERIPNKITDTMGIIVDVNLLYKGELEYLQIIVDKYPSLISFHGKYYYRSGSTMREITGKELERALLKTQGRTWDGVPLPKLSVSDLKQDAMGLKSWKNAPDGKIVKTDVSIAKNYLGKEELAELNEIVTMYLDYATRQARRHIPMTMEDWKTKLDAFLRFNDAEVLQDKGKVTAAIAKEFAESEFEKYRVIQDSLYESDFDKLMNDMEKDDAIH